MKQRLVGLVLGAALLAAACGDDEESTPAPRPPPTLKIASVSSAGGPTWVPGGSTSCVEIGRDPLGTIVVNVAKSDFDLRPPGACGSLRPCGTVAVLLDGTQVAQASTTAVSVPFIGADAAIASGQHTFRVEFRDHDGQPVLDAEQKLLADEVTLEVQAPGGCGGGSDAGPDAAPDAPSDAPADGSDAGSDAASDAEADAVSDASDAAQG